MYSRSTPSASRREPVAHLRQHQLRDRVELVGAVVGKVDVVGDARRHPRIALEERVHPALVAGEDHHQIVALVLHHLQQDLDRLLPVVALVLGAIEVVRLVDEQHAAHRLLEHLARLRRRVADVLADEVVAGHRDEMPFAHVAQPVQDFRHPQRDRRLAGARIAGEAHVQRRRLGGETDQPPAAIDEEQCGDVADPCLDRREPHELAVELVQHLVDLRLAEQRREVDRAGQGGEVGHDAQASSGCLRADRRRSSRSCTGSRGPGLPGGRRGSPARSADDGR